MIDLLLLILLVFTLWAVGGLIVAVLGCRRYGSKTIMTDEQIKGTLKSWFGIIPMLRGEYDPK